MKLPLWLLAQMNITGTWRRSVLFYTLTKMQQCSFKYNKFSLSVLLLDWLIVDESLHTNSKVIIPDEQIYWVYLLRVKNRQWSVNSRWTRDLKLRSVRTVVTGQKKRSPIQTLPLPRWDTSVQTLLSHFSCRPLTASGTKPQVPVSYLTAWIRCL